MPHDLTRRQIRTLFVAGILLVVATTAVLGGYLTNDAAVSGGVVFAAPDGPRANVTESVDLNATDVFPNANTVEIRSSGGNLTLRSQGATTARVEDIAGPTTALANLSVGTATLTVNPGDKQRVKVNGTTDELTIYEMQISDGDVDFAYRGTGGTTTLTIYGLKPDTPVAALDSSGDRLDTGTTNATGVITLTLTNSQHTVSLVTSVSSVAAYYTANSTQVNNATWLGNRSNATLPNVLDFAVRIPQVAIGGTTTAAQGGGFQGPLVLSLLMFGVILGGVGSAGAGMVAGSVIAVTSATALVAVDLAPQWLYAVALFGLGLLLSAVLKRKLE